MDVHAVLLGYGADMEGSGDGTGDGCLLLVVGKAFSGKVGRTAL